MPCLRCAPHTALDGQSMCNSPSPCGSPCARREATDHDPQRREFLQASLLAAASLFVAACGNGVWDAPKTPLTTVLGTTGYTVRLADLPALSTVGGIATVAAGGADIALVRRALDHIDAFWMTCPHQGTTIHAQDGAFVCPNHGARFSATGAWTGGQQTSNLTLIPLTFDAAAGTVTLGVSPPPPPPPTRTPQTLVVPVAKQPGLAAVGGIALFGLDNGYPAAVVRIGSAEYLALSIICPHQGWYMDIDGAGFLCPGHKARFDAHGVWQGGQATTNLKVLASTFDAAAGTVTVTIP